MTPRVTRYTTTGKEISPMSEQECVAAIARLKEVATTAGQKRWADSMTTALEGQIYSDGSKFLTVRQADATIDTLENAERSFARQAPVLTKPVVTKAIEVEAAKTRRPGTKWNARNGLIAVRENKMKTMVDLHKHSKILYKLFRERAQKDAQFSERLLEAFEANGGEPMNTKSFQLAYAAREKRLNANATGSVKITLNAKDADAFKVFTSNKTPTVVVATQPALRWYERLAVRLGFIAAALGGAAVAVTHISN